jgi:hypothetical protein
VSHGTGERQRPVLDETDLPRPVARQIVHAKPDDGRHRECDQQKQTQRRAVLDQIRANNRQTRNLPVGETD